MKNATQKMEKKDIKCCTKGLQSYSLRLQAIQSCMYSAFVSNSRQCFEPKEYVVLVSFDVIKLFT